MSGVFIERQPHTLKRRRIMLGFAIVDRQPTATATAVWLTCRIEETRANHTNAVVIAHDDERYDAKVRALTTERAVVLTSGTSPPLPFAHTLAVDTFDCLIDETFAYQQRIAEAVAAARTPKRKLIMPAFPRTVPKLATDEHDEPQFRALSVANYVAAVWRFWLTTDEQRVRRTINPKTGEPLGIMPEELGDPVLAEFPPGFAELVKPEPVQPEPVP
jgi:hypothetical protein